MDKDVFKKNDWVGRVEKQLAGTDSRDKQRKKRERQGTQKGKRLSVSLAREANIRLETLVSKRPRNSLASIATREGDGGSLGNTDFE